MRSARAAEQAVELIALVDLLLAEWPDAEIRIDGRLASGDEARRLVRQSAERLCSTKIGDC